MKLFIGLLLFAGIAQAYLPAIKDPVYLPKYLEEKPVDTREAKDAQILWMPSEEESVQYARKCARKFKGQFDPRYALIVNYDRDSFYPRMVLVDISQPDSTKIIMQSYSGHGSGNRNEGEFGLDGNPSRAKKLWDSPNSQAVSPGCMVAAPSAREDDRVMSQKADPGKPDGMPLYPGFHLKPLEFMNQCVFTRGQKLHTSPNIIKDKGVVGSSHGCNNILDQDYRFLKKYIKGKGLLMVNYASPMNQATPQSITEGYKNYKAGKINCNTGNNDVRSPFEIRPKVMVAPPSEFWEKAREVPRDAGQ